MLAGVKLSILVGLMMSAIVLVGCVTITRPIVVEPSPTGAAVWATVNPEEALDAALDHFCQATDLSSQVQCRFEQRLGQTLFSSADVPEGRRTACLNSAYLSEFNVFDFDVLGDCVANTPSSSLADLLSSSLSTEIQHQVSRRTMNVPSGCVSEIQQQSQRDAWMPIWMHGDWTAACRSMRFAGESGRWGKYYRLLVDQRATFAFDLEAAEADPYLALWQGGEVDSSMQLLETDDDSGDGRSARLSADLQPGTYIIEATHFADVDPRTSFRLTVMRQ